MEDDHRELVRGIFAAAAEKTETAHEVATAGDYAEAARQLEAAARGIAALAEAAAVIAGPDDGDPAGRADRTPWNDRTSRRFLRAAQAPLRGRHSAISPLGHHNHPSLTRERPCTAPAGA